MNWIFSSAVRTFGENKLFLGSANMLAVTLCYGNLRMSVNHIFHRFGEMEAEIGNEKLFWRLPWGCSG